MAWDIYKPIGADEKGSHNCVPGTGQAAFSARRACVLGCNASELRGGVGLELH